MAAVATPLSDKFSRVLALLAQASMDLRNLNEGTEFPEPFKPIIADASHHIRAMLVPLFKLERFMPATGTVRDGK